VEACPQNALKFGDLGLGLAIKSEKLTQENFTEAVESCLGNPRFRANVAKVQGVSARYNGIEKCAEVIRARA
jgi:UDP:flavonoid glycosyltransferase YjiC (YdhE family)